MKLKVKGWLWKLTGPFASNNFTTIGHTIYHPKGVKPPTHVIKHEQIHEKQWLKVGFLRFYFLYLLAFPFLWNPWRFKWEFEAYEMGSGWQRIEILKELGSIRYGWLKNGAK